MKNNMAKGTDKLQFEFAKLKEELTQKNRELEIERALEKVRARTMAMHKSEELPETSLLLFEQLKNLGEIGEQITIGVFNEAEGVLEISSTIAGSKVSKTYKAPLNESYVMQKLLKGWKKREKSMIIRLSGAELVAYNKYRSDVFIANNEIPRVPVTDNWIIHTVFFTKGFLSFGADTERPKESIQLFERFASAFDLTYTRFLDLQKAEAQAREAQIEAALERIRARSLGMHKSNELKKVVELLYKEIKPLIPDFNTVNIQLNHSPSKDLVAWMGIEGNLYPDVLHWPASKLPFFNTCFEAWKSETGFVNEIFNPDEKDAFFNDLYNHLPVPPERKKLIKKMEGMIIMGWFNRYSSIYLLRYNLTPFSEEEKKVVRRFSSVFEQTYTRFLDLQKAEAQAREAQIEAALERVRAKAMAMHKSEELKEVVNSVVERFSELKIEIDTLNIMIFKDNVRMVEFWTGTSTTGTYDTIFLIPDNINLDLLQKAFKAKREGKESFKITYSKEEKNKLFRGLFKHTNFGAIPEERKKFIYECNGATFYMAFGKNVGLDIISYSRTSFSDEEEEILKRFAKVFDQAYTRFLDLQKAEAQAREAQIEAALERVRAAGMAMHKSDDLAEASTILFEQLVGLGIEARRVGFALPEDDKEEFTVWSTIRDEKGKASLLSAFFYYDQHPIYPKMIENWHAGNKLFSAELHGKDVQDYYKSWNRTFKPSKALLTSVKKNTSEYYQFAYFKQGIIYAFTAQQLSEEQHQLISRFAKAFELTYTRFLDLQKAEAQAREAEIQLALERVRAGTMAMHKSEELSDTASIMFQELKKLGTNSIRTGVCMFDHENDSAELWLATEDEDKMETKVLGKITGDMHPMYRQWIKAHANKKKMYQHKLSGNEIPEYYEKVSADLNLPKQIAYNQTEIYNGFFFNEGSINIISTQPLTEEECDIGHRFANVFGLLYRRFLDLKKAEAQAREAQIEAALERVRAKSLAMHDSQDLHGVVTLVYQQLESIGFFMNSVLLHELKDDEKNFHFWVAANGQVYPDQTHIPVTRNVFFRRFKQAQKNKESLYSLYVTKKQKDSWFSHYFQNSSHGDVPQDRQNFIFSCEGMNISTALHKNTALTVLRYDKTPYDEEQNEVIRRFAQVFEQSYTRFLDLKKAEAQAREAQIEAALERVRAQTMAMHVSTDLQKVITIVREQLEELNMTLDSAMFDLVSSESKDLNLWISSKDVPYSDLVTIPYIKSKLFDNYLKARKEGKKTFTDVLTKKEKDQFFKHGFDHTDLGKIPEERKALILASNEFNRCSAQLKKIALTINNYRDIPYTEEDEQILYRFGQVFEQGFQRFKDLELAEAQAREAQIEAALERVRSKALAMHKSEDLKEAVATVFDELDKLNPGLIRCGIGILEKENPRGDIWITIKGEKGNTIEVSGGEPLDIHPLLYDAYKAWLKQEDYSYTLKGDDLIAYYQAVKQADFHIPVLATLISEDVDQQQYYFNAVFQDGSIFAFLNTPFTEELKTIMRRFANVFNLTYKRFLDLQKAEAQAREAQIQLALERVRARTMAMHKSEELPETSHILFEQMKELGEPADQLTIGIVKEELNAIEISATLHGDKLKKIYNHSIDEPYMMNKIYKAWKSYKKTLIVELKGKELNAYNKYRNELTHSEMFPTNLGDEDRRIVYAAFFSKGMLALGTNESRPSQSLQLLERFASVFDLTYTRFLDLQKAEAQAREAEIELALERVRAKSMAMHASHEIQDVVNVVFNNLMALGIVADSATILIPKPGSKDFDIWIQNSENNYSTRLILPYYATVIGNDFIKAFKAKGKIFNRNYRKEEKDKMFDLLFKHPDSLMNLPKKRKEYVLEGPSYSVSIIFNHNTGIYIGRYNDEMFSDIENNILMRFSKVFEQAYTRFLDLQKAEAQAREAQIEASLERVRSKTMAMHNSRDVGETVATMYHELGHLEFDSFRIGIAILNEGGYLDAWMINNTSSDGETEIVIGQLERDLHPILKGTFKAWKNNESIFTYDLKGQDLINYYTILNDFPKYPVHFDLNALPERQIVTCFYFAEGFLFAFTPDPVDEHNRQTFKRFAGVFGQTYRRYLDLVTAEAQAKEAQIEASLERVRSKAMAMHNSADLTLAAGVVFTELKRLGIQTIRSGVGLLTRESRKVALYSAASSEHGDNLPLVGWAMLENHPVLSEMYDKWLINEDYFPILKGEILKSYYEEIKSTFVVPAQQEDDYEQHGYFICFTHGLFYGWAEMPFTEGEKNILKRFASVVDLTFKRYFDLKKAEAQAREAEIQLALERVRARTMAMQHSSELSETASLFFKQLSTLGIEPNRLYISICQDDSGIMKTWATAEDGSKVSTEFFLDIKKNNSVRKMYQGWKDQKETQIIDMKGRELSDYIHYISKDLGAPVTIGFNQSRRVQTIAYFSKGLIGLASPEPQSDEDINLLKRFAKVFSQTYTRFLDLQNSEHQARKAQIDLAVERVRAKALAMSKSEEIMEVVAKLKEEVMGLDIPDVVAATIFLNEGEDLVRMWDISTLEKNNDGFQIPFDITFKLKKKDPHLYVKRVWENPNDYFFEKQGPKDFKRLIEWLRENNKGDIATEVEEYLENTQLQCLHSAAKKLNKGKLVIDTLTPPLDEMESILTKMGAAFDLAYKRFEDLQKAEAQAREAQIEAALERVRSQSMAMHKSDELLNVISVVSEQLQELKFKFDHASFAINNQKDDYQFWFFGVGNKKPEFLHVPAIDNPVYTSIHSVLKRGDSFYSDVLSKEVNNEWTQHMLHHNDLTVFTPKIRERILNRPMARSIAIMPNIMLILGKYNSTPFTQDENDIIKRFANVFEQTYTRFLDLQKAEAQAREAKVEASLERVRAKAMAMHTSEAVGGAISVMFQELENLGVTPIRCGIIIISSNKTMEAWTTSTDGVDQAVNVSGKLDMTIHPFLEKVFEHWKSGKNLFQYVLEGQDAIAYYRALSDSPEYELPVQSVPKGKHYCSIFLFKEGGLFSYTREPISKNEQKLYLRFTNVFTLTYRRYQDLKAAEQRAREAVRQSSLDRVRGEIASMRTSEDLNRITPVIWRELQALEVPFFRCGVFIVNEKDDSVQMFLTTPEGKALGVLNLAVEANDLTHNIVKSWKKKRIYKTHWDKDEFINWTKSLMDIGQVKNVKTYQGASSAPESLNLHFVPFKQGMLYVGDVAPLSDEKLELVKILSESFSIAYSRYEDFINLEEAKNKTEVTLNELKAAQNQLVQSEKMASLGELTAGIAHEIQNPLNFVNNFSEVSKELIEEMMDELEKGDKEEVEALAKDIIENLEKIAHHGKRADGIVKGMLQHSRTSTGIKEPTDINVLADEYLRLAYHGLRAKDKTFNAIMQTDFDESIGKIKVISQDLGRVILNLITNAFYAVTEKKKQLENDKSEGHYEPTVLVGTKKLGNTVEISVKDNGNGIPQKLIDKIFQPFFSTKPTGQGTGLGLSLSYDIIKAHGGEIKVNSIEKEGTEFKILLLLN